MVEVFPPWQVLVAAYGMAYFLRHKCTFLMGRVSLLDRMLECDFCLGGHGGWVIWLLCAGLQGWPVNTFWGNCFSLVLWTFICAGGVSFISLVVKYLESGAAEDDINVQK